MLVVAETGLKPTVRASAGFPKTAHQVRLFAERARDLAYSCKQLRLTTITGYRAKLAKGKGTWVFVDLKKLIYNLHTVQFVVRVLIQNCVREPRYKPPGIFSQWSHTGYA